MLPRTSNRIATDAQTLVQQLLLYRAQHTTSTPPPPAAGGSGEEEEEELRAITHIVLCSGLHESLEGVVMEEAMAVVEEG